SVGGSWAAIVLQWTEVQVRGSDVNAIGRLRGGAVEIYVTKEIVAPGAEHTTVVDFELTCVCRDNAVLNVDDAVVSGKAIVVEGRALRGGVADNGATLDDD